MVWILRGEALWNVCRSLGYTLKRCVIQVSSSLWILGQVRNVWDFCFWFCYFHSVIQSNSAKHLATGLKLPTLWAKRSPLFYKLIISYKTDLKYFQIRKKCQLFYYFSGNFWRSTESGFWCYSMRWKTSRSLNFDPPLQCDLYAKLLKCKGNDRQVVKKSFSTYHSF